VVTVTVTDTDGRVSRLGYDAPGNFASLTWPDQTVRTFVYERRDLPWTLTGIVDESTPAARFATFAYDGQGRAVSSEHAVGVEKYSVAYGSPPHWTVSESYDPQANVTWRWTYWVPGDSPVLTDPLGNQSALTAGTSNGLPVMTSRSQPAGSGCLASTSFQAFDSAGNLTSADDFNGTRTCHAYDLARGLRTFTLEGLAAKKADGSDNACPSDLAGYVPPKAGDVGYDATHPQRKISTAWLDTWALPTSRAEPGKITTWVYNGRGAKCAPDAPALPDGTAIAVVCSRTEQATNDVTGQAGLGAARTGVARTWSYTYDRFGQVLTEIAPGVDASDTSRKTTYTYYADTSFPDGQSGHTLGDLQSVTRSVTATSGLTMQFTAYDKAGRVLSATDANGAVTTSTYWPRGWLHTQTVTSSTGLTMTTTYDYWPTGLLHKVSLPDGGVLTYAYDDAHRLTDVTDAAGNAVHYDLDPLGNRKGETVSDASGTLVRAIARVFDALGRLQAVTGAAQ